MVKNSRTLETNKSTAGAISWSKERNSRLKEHSIHLDAYRFRQAVSSCSGCLDTLSAAKKIPHSDSMALPSITI
ncbi:hypothetical protein LJB83_01210 [Clostridia bacterium OttesenSCG-928-F22]|nr:hypothetical protein [Clostridia bacterium OttesenSCG-928-F22]